VRRLLAAGLALWLGAAAAHPMLVIGELSFDPDPPAPGQAATLTLQLQETSLAEVEDAVVFVEFRRGEPPSGESAPRGDPYLATEQLAETSPGVYTTTITVPEPGVYAVSIRDRTYRQEEAIANVRVVIGDADVGAVPFILPPTAIGPASLGSWLIWLVGVPLLAGVVVTVLVLRAGGRGEKEEAEAGAEEEG